MLLSEPPQGKILHSKDGTPSLVVRMPNGRMSERMPDGSFRPVYVVNGLHSIVADMISTEDGKSEKQKDKTNKKRDAIVWLMDLSWQQNQAMPLSLASPAPFEYAVSQQQKQATPHDLIARLMPDLTPLVTGLFNLQLAISKMSAVPRCQFCQERAVADFKLTARPLVEYDENHQENPVSSYARQAFPRSALTEQTQRLHAQSLAQSQRDALCVHVTGIMYCGHAACQPLLQLHMQRLVEQSAQVVEDTDAKTTYGNTSVVVARQERVDDAAVATTLQTCGNGDCHKTSTTHPNIKFQRCARCKAVYYCSVECQATAWKSHKSSCTRPA